MWIIVTGMNLGNLIYKYNHLSLFFVVLGILFLTANTMLIIGENKKSKSQNNGNSQSS